MTALTTKAPAGASARPAGPRSQPALLLAALAALLASTCCVLPLAFVLVGISGAWIARLTLLQPYSLGFEALAAAALAFAAWRLFFRAATCAAAAPATRAWFWVIAALALLPAVLSLLAPLFY